MKTKDSYLDLLFENRNKAYGAYELRLNYERRLMKSMGMDLLVASLFFLIPYVLTLIFTHPKKVPDIIKITPYDMTKQFVVIPDKPVVEPKSSHVITDNSVVRIIRNTEVIEAKTDKPNATEHTETGPIDKPGNPGETSGTEGGTIDSPSVPVLPEVMNAAAVDIAPSFPGGEKELL
jgi:protein TonB